MKLSFELDISETSFSRDFTPSAAIRKLPFCLTSTGAFQARKNYFTERENMAGILVLYTLAGEGELEYGGKRYIVKRDDIMLIDCDKPHCYRTSERAGRWDFAYAHVNGTAAQGMFELITGWRDVVFGADADRMQSLFDVLLNVRELDSLDEAIFCSEALSALFGELAGLRKGRSPANETGDRAERAIEYIKANFHRKVTVDELCECLFLSKFYFIKLFRSHTGVTPYEYLSNYRVNQAKYLLRNTSKSVSEICFACGFEDTSNFIRTFKKIAGITPLQFRKAAI